MFDIKLMPKIVDVEQYRKELLLKSAELFAEKGYANMTTRELAQGLGVSTGTLYHYFPSKAALFEQLVEEMCREDVLLAKAEIDRGKTLTEKLKILGKFMINREDSCIKQLFLSIDYSQHQGREELRRSHFFVRVDRRYGSRFSGRFYVRDVDFGTDHRTRSGKWSIFADFCQHCRCFTENPR